MGARQVEQTAAQAPVAGDPFRRDAIAVAPGIGGIVEGARIHDAPVEEIAARVMGVSVGVENVGDGEFSACQDQRVGGVCA